MGTKGISRLVQVAVLPAALALAAVVQVCAQPVSLDSKASQQLTRYFSQHRLPLVGAQVIHTTDGEQQVMLYGFVATPFGKTDAEKQARAFLKQPHLQILNRIEVRPEIRNLKPTPSQEQQEETQPEDDTTGSSANMRRGLRDDCEIALLDYTSCRLPRVSIGR